MYWILYTITAKEVAKHSNIALNTIYSVNQIGNIMIKQLKLSFKRVKYRSNNIDLGEIKLLDFYLLLRLHR